MARKMNQMSDVELILIRSELIALGMWNQIFEVKFQHAVKFKRKEEFLQHLQACKNHR